MGEDGWQGIGVIAHKNYSRTQDMEDAWENATRKAHNWTLDETSGLVGVEKNNGMWYSKRYFWGIMANV